MTAVAGAMYACLSVPRPWIRPRCRQADGWRIGATQDMATLLHGVTDGSASDHVQRLCRLPLGVVRPVRWPFRHAIAPYHRLLVWSCCVSESKPVS